MKVSEPTSFVWTPSPDVPVLVRPVREVRVAQATPPELSRLASALDAIPNEGDKELDYDKWFAIVAGIDHATEHSDDGYALALAFSSRAAKFDQDFFDTRVWPYLRSDRAGPAYTANTVFAAAYGNDWPDPEMISGFECVEQALEEASAKPKRGYQFLQTADYVSGEPLSWIVKGVIPQAVLGLIYGASGSGKSFFALDLAVAVATGREWRGKRVVRGRVAYIAAEGAGGMRNRLKAACEQHGIEPAALDIFTLAAAPNFMEPAPVKAVIAAVLAAGPFSLLFIDTLAQVSAGANENSGEDMGRVLKHCEEIHRATGAMVMLVHHSGKDESKGARGWSGLKGPADVEISILRAEQDRVAKVSKMKDGEDGGKFGFRLHVVNIGTDSDGDPITSCTIEYTAVVAGIKRVAPDPAHEVQAAVWQIAIDVLGLGGATTVGAILDEYVARTPRDPASTKRDTRRQHADRAVKALVANGTLNHLDGAISVPSEEGDE